MARVKNSAPMPCIYCKKINTPSKKKKSQIPVEHVIPEMLGLFGKDTMTLTYEVCSKLGSSLLINAL